MSFTTSLTYLENAVREELGDGMSELIPAGFIARALNEGQRRLEPTHLQEKVLTGVTLAVDDTSYALPADLREVTEFVPADDSQGIFPPYREHGSSVYFHCPVTLAFTGTLFYRGHYPTITEDVDCELPQGAVDALVSFALYKCYHRFVANRAEYRKFATIVGNGVSLRDLQDTAEALLADFKEAAESSGEVAPPEAW